MRGDFCQGRQNFFKYGTNANEYIVIPESDDSKTELIQHLRTFRVFHSVLQMLPTIQFNDETGRQTGEINNVYGQLVLPPKFPVFKTSATQMTPQNLLGISHAVTQSACKRDIVSFHAAPSP